VTAEKETRLELERSNRALDDFAYVASHDLRAPLRDIDNLAKWVNEDLDDVPEATARHLGLLRQRVGRMDRLLTELLEYSRAGRVFAEPERFDTDSLIESVQGVVPTRDGIDVRYDVPTYELVTPRPPLELILRNLIGNAIRHHDRDEGRVDVSLRVEDGFAVFRVADDGPGIEPRYHERIFEMFQTLRTSDRVDGTGMGLALCRKLASVHDGELTVESDGRGTTFTCRWPTTWKRRP